MDDEQVFAIGLVSLAISTSEAAKEKNIGYFLGRRQMSSL